MKQVSFISFPSPSNCKTKVSYSFILQLNDSNPNEILFHIIKFFIRFILRARSFRHKQQHHVKVKVEQNTNKLERKKGFSKMYGFDLHSHKNGVNFTTIYWFQGVRGLFIWLTMELSDLLFTWGDQILVLVVSNVAGFHESLPSVAW